MDIISSFATIAFVALIHASFQLSVSVLTLLGSHTIGARLSRKKVARLFSSYILGAGVMTLLLISFAALVFLYAFGKSAPLMAWAIVCGIVLGIGVAVWIFYYRKGAGTSLWISRGFAQHLAGRSKQTKTSVEAFSLGMTSVISEIIFIAPTIALAALVLIGMPPHLQATGLAIYTVLSLAGLLSAWAFLGSGRSLSRIQRWRETNKRFLQFCAGSALIVIGTFVYVTKVVAESSGVL